MNQFDKLRRFVTSAGALFPRRFFILDEAQQLAPLEAKTVITRMSRGSKLVMVGDPAQIDNPYVDSRSNGLVYAGTGSRARKSPRTSASARANGVRLPRSVRG
jgi:PhoH-like ATPase